MPRLLTLDLDDTLWPCLPVILRAEHELFDWLAAQAPQLAVEHDIDSLRRQRMAYKEAHPELAHDISALRVAALEVLLADYGYAARLANEALSIFLNARNRVTPYDDVIPVLQRINSDHLLVSVTNGNAEVDATPLVGHFHHQLSAASVGASKPDPTMFEQALNLCGCDAGEAVHIGDDPWLDIEPARQLGMKTVWVNRRQSTWPEELEPADLSVETLEPLPRWLEKA